MAQDNHISNIAHNVACEMQTNRCILIDTTNWSANAGFVN